MKKLIFFIVLLSFLLYSQPQVLWNINVGGKIYRSLALSPEGDIILVTEGGKLLCIGKDGKKKWEVDLGGPPKSYPVVGLDGRIFVISSANEIVIVSKEGYVERKVEVRAVISSPPSLSSDGILYVATENGKLIAISTTAISTLWEFSAKDIIKAPPVIGVDGAVFFGSYDSYFYGLEKDGSLRWKVNLEVPSSCAAAIGTDYTIYVPTKHYYLFAIDGNNGKVKWKFKFNNTYPVSPPVVAYNGTIFVTTKDGKIHSISPEGKLLREFTTDWELLTSPLLTPENTLLVGAGDSFLYNLSFSLQPFWKNPFSVGIEANPVISPDKVIYVPSVDGILYATKIDVGGLDPRAYWPRFQADNRNSGQAIR